METRLIIKAKEYAFRMHDQPSESQRYGNEPYSKHLLDVVSVALRYIYYIHIDAQEDVIASAYLHDCIEDTATNENKLLELFNERVSEIVWRVSNERGRTKKEVMFKTLPKIWQHDLACFVKLSDRIANGTNSKNGQSDKSKRMFLRYKSEYPIFRYALKTEGLYDNMWSELDEIFEFKICM